MKISLLRRAALSALGPLLFAAGAVLFTGSAFLFPGCALLFPRSAGAATNGFPFTAESLNYSVNWPSGLNLGEGHLRASQEAGNWSFDLTLNASVPGFDVIDHYHSSATPDFCSTSFDRTSSHGTRKTKETETISNGEVTRQTDSGGGKSELRAQACVKDALTFLFFTRRELGQGRVPPPQQIVYGSLYSARLDYVGAPVIQIAGKPEQSDMLTCTMTGPTSTIKFEMYFARDAARTPLLIRVPLQMGSFAMELVR
ncbi:MAG TPA: DUF3108 domain-containing protein [Bryobacteraceae bacterium]|nr:DUF3108 domain-containing protein [Bryobacteraceae bacterium]